MNREDCKDIYLNKYQSELYIICKEAKNEINELRNDNNRNKSNTNLI